jgi:putative oxidoreductase
MTMAFALTALAVLGGGQASLDHALDLDLDGVAVGLAAAAAGVVGAAGMLVTSWRPARTPD